MRPDTDLAGAVLIAESARASVERLRIPNATDPTGHLVSISGGIAALLSAGDMNAERLITVADEGLFESKWLGRNRMDSAQAEHVFGLAGGTPTKAKPSGVRSL